MMIGFCNRITVHSSLLECLLSYKYLEDARVHELSITNETAVMG